MKKKYLCLAVVWIFVYLLAGCGLTDRLLEVKHASESEVRNELDEQQEEITEKETTEKSEERSPEEVREEFLAKLEESLREPTADTDTTNENESAEADENTEENAEETPEENTEENAEGNTEKDDFSDIDLDTYAYSSNRDDFPSDVAFANFRGLSGGAINGNMFYRSSSPVCNVYSRAPYVDAFVEAAGIKCVLNLSDSSKEVNQFMVDSGYCSPYYKSLFESGKVLTLNMDSRYYRNEFAFTLADGLRKMLYMEGPVLIHCIEGKDRTGFVCMLLEGLAGATYQEIIDDYMTTYYNYYPGLLEEDRRLYECIKYTYMDDMIRYISGSDEDADLSGLDMRQWSRQYLYNAGLTEEELDLLEARLKS